MSFSLLFKTENRPRRTGSADALLLGETMKTICSDAHKAAVFTEIIDSPLELGEDIEYRREIVADLESDPALARRLKTVFARYDRMRGDWAETRGAAVLTPPDDADPEASLEAAWSALRRMAVFPAALSSFIGEIREITSSGGIRSGGLHMLNARCSELSDGELKALSEAAELFRFSSPETHEPEITAFFDPLPFDGGYSGVRICGLKEIVEKKRGLSAVLQKKPKKGVLSSDGEVTGEATALAALAAYDLGTLFASRIGAIYDEFFGISEEMCFYECALEYLGHLKEKGAGYCLPDPEEEGVTLIRGLYDLRLTALGETPVPSDAAISADSPGLLIRGENGSGKTTFLRALGTAQLLFQAGLPIPAGSAAMSVCSGVFTHFASAEEDFRAGDRAGRFEGEARAVSAIADRLRPGSLLLMNETFQTTSYEDGTRLMRDILGVFGEVGVKYVLVTHLTDLFTDPPRGAQLIEFDSSSHKYKYV